jgi:glycosyltransferase involved in cell wall biosynthesis
MMRARGFEVFHYGIEGSDSGADRDIQLMTRDEWDIFRILSYKKLHPDVSHDEVVRRLEDPTQYIGNLGNWDTPLYKEFNLRLKDHLKEHYRSTQTDIVCLPFGRAHDAALEGLNAVKVESGIGYPDSYRNYRIFESHTWMHTTLAKESKSPQNYWFVAPNYFDVSEWTFSPTPLANTVGFFGRINDGKGCHLIVEVARRMPHVTFFLCGQGDPAPYLKCPNIKYKAPIHGRERSDYLGSLSALLAPTQWVEPFCGVAVEAQLCGTPVVTSDWGAQTETVEPFKTGLQCHTLADYCLGIQMALDGKFDRLYIRERAVSRYSLEAVGKSYEHALKSIMDVHNGKNGWYSATSHLACMTPEPTSSRDDLP